MEEHKMLYYKGSSLDTDAIISIKNIESGEGPDYLPESLSFHDDELPEEYWELVNEKLEEHFDLDDKEISIEIFPSNDKSFAFIEMNITGIKGDKPKELEKYKISFEEFYNQIVPRIVK